MKSAVYFVDEQVKQTFFALATGKAETQEIHVELGKAYAAIANDAFCGIQVPKRLIPKTYLTMYGIDNLWKYNFHKNWRLMYSVAGDGTSVIALIIEWLPHREYERRFGY